MNKSLVIYGPRGCGKTKSTAKFLKKFGLEHSGDLDSQMGTLEQYGWLYFATTYEEAKASGLRVMQFQ